MINIDHIRVNEKLIEVDLFFIDTEALDDFKSKMKLLIGEDILIGGKSYNQCENDGYCGYKACAKPICKSNNFCKFKKTW